MSAVQAEPKSKETRQEGCDQGLTAQASNGKGEEQGTTWGASVIVQAGREEEETRPGSRQGMSHG